MKFLEEPNFDFLGPRRIAFAVSTLIFLATIATLVAHGGPKLSIDFAGGSLLQMRFPQAVEIDAIRSRLADIGAGDAEIQRFGGPDEVLIRIPETGDPQHVANVKAALSDSVSGWPGVELRREESVGPKVGDELRSAAIQSVVLALLLLLAYITFRFEFRWAVAGIVALVHDVVVTVGALSFTNREFSLTIVAALLTIVGFSINDTIVIFDRVRENLRVPSREPFEKILNRSINQTLSRTIITSGTVLATVLALLFFGGEVLNDFAFAMTAGVISGTYSTVYVATAIVMEWERRWPRRGRKVQEPAAQAKPPKPARKKREPANV